NGQPLRILEGHTSIVNACAFSPDGRFILSASGDSTGHDNTLRVWEAATGQPLRTLEGHTGSVDACAFSPGGRLIVSASWDTLRVWEAATSQPLRTLRGHTSIVHACAFSPDGRLIVSASWDNTLRVWEAASGQPLRTLEGHAESVKACAFSPDGRWIVSASYDGTLRVWKPGNGELLAYLPLPGALHSLGLHPFTPQMVCGDSGGAVYWLEIVGLEYGPIVVTAAEGEQGIEVRCPACQHRFQIEKEWLGSEITCPQDGCNTRLKLNPFVINRS
ncbi:MAG: WD40 repeat domain-containing protein, partial [Chloroflexi bacterium]|nr:WD40 repeat domain-containing protein [Chloroflexota bacterium]